MLIINRRSLTCGRTTDLMWQIGLILLDKDITVKHWYKNNRLKPATMALGVAGILTISGCSFNDHPYDPNDPLQTVNRATFAFNQQFDRFLLKPTAKVYKTVVPGPARKGVNNFFMNLNEVPTTVNYLLQAQPGPAYESFWRLLINSTIGIGGLFDVASHMGLQRTTNDFGITLSKWGFSSSPYFVIPFLGPSNIRDGLSLLVDYKYFTVWPYMHDVALRNVLLGVDMVRIRANLLDSENILDVASFDKYTVTRDAYVQYRYQLITTHGGKYDQGATYEISPDELNSDLEMNVSATKSGMVKPPYKDPDSAIRTNAMKQSAQKTLKAEAQPKPTSSTTPTTQPAVKTN
ncbi:MAG: VacJ family lipoprotein [Gammaproteobacteria bacterium]